jgi:LmbE family N-acetylglucosaminyl deacetylase
MVSQLDDLLQPAGAPRSVREMALPGPLQVLVLAPHPDDFDAIGLTLRHLHQLGHQLHLAVLTTGASGVDDGFGGAQDDAAKAALREDEQRASCAFFGLPPQRVTFLRLWSEGRDDPAPLRAWMQERPADLLFLPHGNDSNRTHQRTYAAACGLAEELGLQAWAFLNQDAKTLGMRVDLFFDFEEEDAAWKAQLLRLHASQQARNLRTRGAGFDQRVLAVNRAAAAGLPTQRPYAEAFELLWLTPAAPPRRSRSS